MPLGSSVSGPDIRQLVRGRVNDRIRVINPVLFRDSADVLALRPKHRVASAVRRRNIHDIARQQDLRQPVIVAPGDRLAFQSVSIGDPVDRVAAQRGIARHLGARPTGNDREGVVGQAVQLQESLLVERYRRRQQQIDDLRRADSRQFCRRVALLGSSWRFCDHGLRQQRRCGRVNSAGRGGDRSRIADGRWSGHDQECSGGGQADGGKQTNPADNAAPSGQRFRLTIG